jgi:hypothetical protein
MINDDLEDLHRLLNGCVIQLARAQEDATELEAVRAIGREIDEVGNRATLVGQLLFKAKTVEITAAVEDVKAFKHELDQAIAEIERLNRFLETIASFLTLVDKAIDLAKIVI